MKKTLLFAGLLCSVTAFSQTTLFSDNFESGSTNWTLNGGTGDNQWIVNNTYAGNLGFNIVDTPNEPSGILNFPNSFYLHITNNSFCSTFSVCNASFLAGAGASNQNAALNTTLVTTGMNTVTISFYYLSGGAAGISFGSLQYSIDNGSTWTNAGTYDGVSTWTQASVTLPAWDNQANLKFRFNWVDGASGVDPAFSIDEVKITAIGSSETITGVAPDNTSGWCFNDESTFNLDFTSAGTYTVGNTFTVELSDASGSFTAPTTIGTLSSTTSGSLSIPCTIPLGTAVGTAYRVRVTSSNPAVISADNGTDLEIHAIPTVGGGVDQSVCVGQNVTLAASGATTYQWDNGITNNVPFTPTLGVTIFTVTGTSAAGCVNTDQVSVTATDCSGIEEYENAAHISIYPNPTNDQFTVEGTTQISSIKVIDLSGRTMMTFEPTTSNNYSIAELTAGTYFVIISAGKSEFSKRIVKQ